MAREFITPAECPVCGEAVPRGAKACPGCGADERSGWNEDDTRYDGLDLPAGAFDDEGESAPRPAFRIWMGATAIVAVLAWLLFILR